jgi:hypothetical protein
MFVSRAVWVGKRTQQAAGVKGEIVVSKKGERCCYHVASGKCKVPRSQYESFGGGELGE